jgi:hypothetical protein
MMRNNERNKILLFALVALAAIYTGNSLVRAQNQRHSGTEATGQACRNDDSGLQPSLTLPDSPRRLM